MNEPVDVADLREVVVWALRRLGGAVFTAALSLPIAALFAAMTGASDAGVLGIAIFVAMLVFAFVCAISEAPYTRTMRSIVKEHRAKYD